MIERRMQVRTWRIAVLAVFLVLGLSAASQAGPLGVYIDPFPDVSAGMITTTYNATSGAFAANGWALSLNTGTGAQPLATNFKLLATIDTSGAISGASLLIGSAVSPYLTSLNLIGFAYSAVQAGAIEFLFGTSGGSYMGAYYPTTQPIDVMLSPGAAFLGNFKSSFTSTGGSAEIRPDTPDTAGTPEPSALLLVMVAGIAMGAVTLYSRRRGTLAEF